MTTLLKGKKALVTGGTAGIGKAIATLFVKEGADVAILGTNRERAEKVVQEMEALKQNDTQKIASYLVDVSKYEDVESVTKEFLETFSGIDILVNNAGITRDNLLLRMREEDWDLVLDVNLKSVYNLCRCLIRPMMKNRSGSIINISSVVGLTGNAGQVNYAASKSGMIGFSKSLAKELASRNIRVNCIAPGYIETEMTGALPAEIRESILSKIPLSRIGQPEDIAQMALFLASDHASYITMQVVSVDGGMAM